MEISTKCMVLKEMTTGMSAPPMASVNMMPHAPERAYGFLIYNNNIHIIITYS